MRTSIVRRIAAFLAVLLSAPLVDAQIPPSDLLIVTDANELVVVDVDGGCTATIVGPTQDAVSPFTLRRIRGLAYDDINDVVYAMTREGDLVTVDRTSGATTHVLQLPCGTPSTEFWGGIAFDGTDKLYSANAFDDHELAEITLGTSPTATCVGSTVFNGTVALQILGVATYPASAPAVPPTFNGVHPNLNDLYGANRSNDNIVVVDKSTGAVTFAMGNQTIGVSNVQAIAFRPTTGVLYGLHDHFSQSNNAALSTYDFAAATATELCELPFGIVENVGGGNDTYGWGGLTWAPPAPSCPTPATCSPLVDGDNDGICDSCDNCVDEFNPDQLNSDCPANSATFFVEGCCATPSQPGCCNSAGGCPGGSVPGPKRGCCDGGDVCDVCPADKDDSCDPESSGGISIGASGGSLVTPDGCISVVVPAGALPGDTSISVTEGIGANTSFQVNASQVIHKLAMRPSGQSFDPPVTISFCWDDRDGDLIVDRGVCDCGAGNPDDGLPCDSNAGCDCLVCTQGSITQESNLVLKRNSSRFSKLGFNPGASPFKCSDHASGACVTAAANCSGSTAGSGTSSVANCCTPAAWPVHGSWQFQTCWFSDIMSGETEGDLIPGKGSPKTDCVAEWSVNNAGNDPFLDRKGLPNFKQVCTDGDPECDTDGATDGKCTFNLGVCVNVADERLRKKGVVACAPSDIVSWQIKKPRPDSSQPAAAASAVALRDAVRALDPGGSASVGGRHQEVVTFSAPVVGLEECALLANVEVPLRGPALDKKGKQTVKAAATPSPPGKRDSDKLKLTCLPPAD